MMVSPPSFEQYVAELTSIGITVMDLISSPVGDWDTFDDKVEVRQRLANGSAPCHASRAFRCVTGIEPVVCAITGADAVGNFSFEVLHSEFPRAYRAAAAGCSRISSIVPKLPDSVDTLAFTPRPVLDAAAALELVLPHARRSRHVFIGSLGASDAEFHFLEQLTDAVDAPIYWIPTKGQCRQPERLHRVADRVQTIQLNESEFQTLQGTKSTVERELVSDFASTTMAENVIVTAGARGVFAVTNSTPHHIPAFDLAPITRTSGAGDTFAGAVLAGQSIVPGDWRLILHAASAAAALWCTGRVPRGWDELIDVIRHAPTTELEKRASLRGPHFAGVASHAAKT